MSVELRLIHTNPDQCDCGTVQPIGYHWKCTRELVCDWGVFNNAEADPRCGLRHLMLITPETVARMLADGPEPGTRGGTASATRDGERLFVHLDYAGTRTTWELFEAHWWDDNGPDILVGRWPD